MATIPASENIFPLLELAEGAAPATPPTGNVRLYVKSDGLLYWKDDAGTEYAVGQGDVTAHLADTTDAHDASAVSFSPTGTIAATDVQAAIAEVASEAAAGGYASGTSFPGGPSTGDIFHRTDRTPALWRYDGTRWRSVNTYTVPLNVKDSTAFSGDSSGSTVVARWTIPFNGATYTTYCLVVELTSIVVTTNDGSNNWTFQTTTQPSNTAVGSGMTTASDTHTTHVYHSMTVNALLTSTDEYLNVGTTKVASPGNLFLTGLNVHYQLVTT